MNILELLKNEINILKIDNKYKIARYLYIRTGEIFNYDPIYVFSSEEIRELLKKKKINSKNVTSFDLICFSWANLYAELLESFNIKYQIIRNDNHAAIIVVIDNKMFLADLTNRNIDISRIKFGTKIQNFYQIYRNKNEEKFSFQQIDNEIYTKGVELEKTISKLKTSANILKTQMPIDEYNYFFFNLIQKIVNIPRENVGFMSGIVFISELLKEFNFDKNNFRNTHYFDINKKIFIDVYETLVNGNSHYFAYQKYNKNYRLQEISKEDVIFFSNKYLFNGNSSLTDNSFVKVSKRL